MLSIYMFLKAHRNIISNSEHATAMPQHMIKDQIIEGEGGRERERPCNEAITIFIALLVATGASDQFRH